MTQISILCSPFSEASTPSVSLLVSSLLLFFIHHLVPHSAEIFGLTNEQQNSAETNFKDLGPISRICIDFVADLSLLIDYKNHRQVMITDLTSQSLRRFVLAGRAINLDAESHAIFIHPQTL